MQQLFCLFSLSNANKLIWVPGNIEFFFSLRRMCNIFFHHLSMILNWMVRQQNDNRSLVTNKIGCRWNEKREREKNESRICSSSIVCKHFSARWINKRWRQHNLTQFMRIFTIDPFRLLALFARSHVLNAPKRSTRLIEAFNVNDDSILFFPFSFLQSNPFLIDLNTLWNPASAFKLSTFGCLSFELLPCFLANIVGWKQRKWLFNRLKYDYACFCSLSLSTSIFPFISLASRLIFFLFISAWDAYLFE